MADEQEKKEQQDQQEQRGTLLTFINPATGAGTVKSNFTKIPNSIIFDKNISSQDMRLYSVLLALPYRKRCSAREGILINHDYLCELTGAKNRQTILRSITRLEKAGYCRRVKISGKLSELQVIIRPSVSEEEKKKIEELISDV